MHFHLLTHALKTSLPHSKALIMPSKLSPTPFPSIPDSHYKNRILDEVTWLNATNKPMFAMHGLGIILTGVIIQKKKWHVSVSS